MATIPYTGGYTSRAGETAIYRKWILAAVNDDGQPTENASFADRSVQVSGGTFGGSTVTIEGSNDGVTWYSLSDQAGSALTFTSAGLRQVLQVTKFLRPKLTGGTGTNVEVHLISVRK